MLKFARCFFLRSSKNIIFGNFCISNPHIVKNFYDSLESSLKGFVASVSPPASKIAFSLIRFPRNDS